MERDQAGGPGPGLMDQRTVSSRYVPRYQAVAEWVSARSEVRDWSKGCSWINTTGSWANWHGIEPPNKATLTKERCEREQIRRAGWGN